jgi:hypothetical protein
MLFTLVSVSRTALGPTQPPIQWVPGVLSPGIKRGRSVTLATHPHLERAISPLPPSASMVCCGTALQHNASKYVYRQQIKGWDVTRLWTTSWEKVLFWNKDTNTKVKLYSYWGWSSESSGIYCRVLNWMSADVSEIRAASVIRAMATHRPDDGGSTYLWNVGRYLIKNTAVHPRRFWASYSPPWEPEISHYIEDIKRAHVWKWLYFHIQSFGYFISVHFA